MNSLDALMTGQSDALAARFAKDFDIAADNAGPAVDKLVDELTWALERNTLSRGGVADLVEMVGHGQHERFLDGDVDLNAPETKSAGDEVLSQVLFSKHQSRGVAEKVARDSDVSYEVVKRMLPAVAALLMGGMEKQVGGEIEELAQRFGGTDAIAPQRPLPLPSDTVDYGGRPNTGGGRGRSPFDDLSDMIRRGGRGGGRSFPFPGRTKRAPSGASGSVLSQVIRQIFGNLLGFQSKGIVGWLIRLFLVRYGWRILQGILRRIF